MKTLAVAALTLFVASGVQAAGGPCGGVRLTSGPAAPQMVSLDLKDTPLNRAFGDLFKQWLQVPYGITGEAAFMIQNTKVSLRLENVAFHEALETLTKAHGLTYRDIAIHRTSDSTPEGQVTGELWKTFLIDVALPRTHAEDSTGRPSPAGREVSSDLVPKAPVVTLHIPAMPVENAMARIEPGWSFRDFGDRTMPGASFYKLPKDMAAAMVLIAAGLKPPTDGSKLVTEELKGQPVSISELFQWRPEDQKTVSAEQSPVAPATGYHTYRGGYGGYSRPGSASPQVQEPAIALGGYNRPAGNDGDGMLLTVLVRQAQDIDVLEKLFSVSGQSYVMGDIRQRPRYEEIVQNVGQGQIVRSRQLILMPPRAISAQLYDVTLEQAVDHVTRAADLVYKKTGRKENPTYEIDMDRSKEKTVRGEVIEAPAAPEDSEVN